MVGRETARNRECNDEAGINGHSGDSEEQMVGDKTRYEANRWTNDEYEGLVGHNKRGIRCE